MDGLIGPLLKNREYLERLENHLARERGEIWKGEYDIVERRLMGHQVWPDEKSALKIRERELDDIEAACARSPVTTVPAYIARLEERWMPLYDAMNGNNLSRRTYPTLGERQIFHVLQGLYAAFPEHARPREYWEDIKYSKCELV